MLYYCVILLHVPFLNVTKTDKNKKYLYNRYTRVSKTIYKFEFVHSVRRTVTANFRANFSKSQNRQDADEL